MQHCRNSAEYYLDALLAVLVGVVEGVRVDEISRAVKLTYNDPVWVQQGDTANSNKYLREAVVRGFDDLEQFGEAPRYEEWRVTQEFRTMQRTPRSAARRWVR